MIFITLIECNYQVIVISYQLLRQIHYQRFIVSHEFVKIKVLFLIIIYMLGCVLHQELNFF